MVNSRPLIYADDDINSSFIITPLNFLSLNPEHTIPDCVDDEVIYIGLGSVANGANIYTLCD